MIDLEWYRSFVAVYRIGTVTRAAAELGLTQPAVTQHIAALEAALSTPLFTRTPRRMVPTEQGQALYSSVAQALETLERASHTRGGATADHVPLVQLGTPREYFAAIVLARLRTLGMRVRVQFGTARALLDALARGEVDVVVATERITMREVEYRKLAEEEFVLVGSPQLAPPVTQPTTAVQHPQLEHWLLEQPWISYGPDLPIIRRFWRQSFTRRPAIEPALIIPDLLIIAQAVARGQGVSVLPLYLCAEAIAGGHMQLLWQPARPVTNDIWLAYRALDRQRPTVLAMHAALTAAPHDR